MEITVLRRGGDWQNIVFEVEDSVTINVVGEEEFNSLPIVSTSQTGGGFEGTNIGLSGTATDPDGSIESTLWSLVGCEGTLENCPKTDGSDEGMDFSITDPASLSTSFVVGNFEDDELVLTMTDNIILEFKLEAVDDGGATGESTCLRNVNVPDPDCSVAWGDMNGDAGLNVLDIVLLANCVLAGDCSINCENSASVPCYGCAGDLNVDGGYNILDIVILANCILSDCDE